MVTRNQFSTLEMRKSSPYFSALKLLSKQHFMKTRFTQLKPWKKLTSWLQMLQLQ